MIEGTMKCYKCGKRSYDDNACLDEETGLPCWRSRAVFFALPRSKRPCNPGPSLRLFST